MFVLLCVFLAMVVAAMYCFYSDATSGNFHSTSSYTVTRKKEENKNEKE